MDMELFKVGGCVRDELLGLKTKDIDFTVVVDLERFPLFDDGFAHMESELTKRGFKIFQTRPEFGTIRAQFPADMLDEFGGVKDADFVLARRDGVYIDGRRPESVHSGTLEQDLMRRDFTVNALAKTSEGDIIDRHNGLRDVFDRKLRFVGDPIERIKEDSLRVMRAFRFSITKGFEITPKTWTALTDPIVPELLAELPDERRCEELRKMFDFDTMSSMKLMNSLSLGTSKVLVDAMFAGSVRLTATMQKESKR